VFTCIEEIIKTEELIDRVKDKLLHREEPKLSSKKKLLFDLPSKILIDRTHLKLKRLFDFILKHCENNNTIKANGLKKTPLLQKVNSPRGDNNEFIRHLSRLNSVVSDEDEFEEV